jgi:hypothetical protein
MVFLIFIKIYPEIGKMLAEIVDMFVEIWIFIFKLFYRAIRFLYFTTRFLPIKLLLEVSQFIYLMIYTFLWCFIVIPGVAIITFPFTIIISLGWGGWEIQKSILDWLTRPIKIIFGYGVKTKENK